MGAVIGRRVGRDFGAVEVGQGADAEATVALGLAAHAIAALRVVLRAGVSLAGWRVARDEDPPGNVAAVRLAVMRREAVDADRVAGSQLDCKPIELGRDVGPDDAAVVDRENIASVARKPKAPGLDTTIVDRDED